MKYRIVTTRPNCQCGKCKPFELVLDSMEEAKAEVHRMSIEIVLAGLQFGMLLLPDQSKTTEGNFHCDFMRGNPQTGQDEVEVTITASPIHLH